MPTDIPTHLLTASLLVNNMHCPSCIDTIRDALRNVPSVHNLTVSLLLHRITFNVDSKRSASVIDHVKRILRHEGFSVSTPDEPEEPESDELPAGLLGRLVWKRREVRADKREEARRRQHLEHCEQCRAEALGVSEKKQVGTLKTTLSIEGMTCGSCSSSIASALEANPLVLEGNINVLTASGVVTHKAGISSEELVELVEDLGYEAKVVESVPEAPSGGGDKLVTTIYSIEGMTCASCTSSIEAGLKDVDGIEKVDVNLLNSQGTVTHRASLSDAAIKELIEDIGFGAEVVRTQDAEDGERAVTIWVDGVFCGNCITQLNAHLATLKDVRYTPFTLKNPQTTITYTPGQPYTVRDLVSGLAGVAPEFDAEVVRPTSVSERSQAIQKREVRILAAHLVAAVILAIPTFIIAIVSMVMLKMDHPFRRFWDTAVWGGANRGTIVLWVLATVVQFGIGRFFYVRAYHGLAPHIRSLLAKFHLCSSPRPWTWRSLISFGSMDLLVALSTTVSYFASVAMLAIDVRHPGRMSIGSYFDASVFVIMFILLGRTLEAYAKAKTTDAVALLGALRPATAFLVEDEKDEAREIPVDLVERGDVLLVHPGALPPADGIVVYGTSSFDESSLTGEAVPVAKVEGDEVYTGTTNLSSAVHIAVTGLGGDTMLDKIIAAVSRASKAPLEKAAETLTGVFVPVICYFSIFVLALWLGLTYGGVVDPHNQAGRAFFAIEFCVAVLVVACPCGIGLAVPCANAVGTGLAAKAGILAGGGEAFTGITKVTTVALDKTGTLTQGKPAVVAELIMTEDKEVPLATRALEATSTHPLAVGLTEHLSSLDGSVEVISSEEIAGRGLTAKLGGGLELAIGNDKLMTDHSVDLTSVTPTLEEWGSAARSVVLVAARRNEEPWSLAAAYALSDPLRPSTAPILAQLQKRGFRVVMLTGDNERTAQAIGKELGLKPEDVHAGLGPQDKADAIARIQAESIPKRTWRGTKDVPNRVLFVGDGINDSIALSTAACSVAMGHGSQSTLAAADFVLLSSDLASIPDLLKLSRKVVNRQWINLGWAMVFNVVCLPIAAGILYPAGIRLSPVWSAILMAASSVSVILSSLALRWGL